MRTKPDLLVTYAHRTMATRLCCASCTDGWPGSHHLWIFYTHHTYIYTHKYKLWIQYTLYNHTCTQNLTLPWLCMYTCRTLATPLYWASCVVPIIITMNMKTRPQPSCSRLLRFQSCKSHHRRAATAQCSARVYVCVHMCMDRQTHVYCIIHYRKAWPWPCEHELWFEFFFVFIKKQRNKRWKEWFIGFSWSFGTC